MRFSLLAFLLLSFQFIIVAQELGPPVLFGDIPRPDLKMTTYEPDTSAAALVLVNYGNVQVIEGARSYECKFEHHKRIKILKKSGFSYGDVRIPYYSKDNRESFYFVKAEVTLPDGTKYKLNKKKDVFDEKMSENWSSARFTMPQLQEGAVIEYSYVIVSDNISTLRDWFFQEEIPTLWSEYRVEFPNRFEYTYLAQGLENLIRIENKPERIVFQRGSTNLTVLPGRFIMQSTPALKDDEPYLTTVDDYRFKIRFQLNLVNYPDGRKEKFLSTWPEVQKKLEFEPFFGEQFLKRGNFKKIMEVVLPQIEGLKTQKEKAVWLYGYLVKEMTWNGAFSVFTRPQSLNDIFETKTASSGEINLMLLALLREAGITAYPLLVSTRDNGKVIEDCPLLGQFSHVLVYALPDAMPTMMDATDPLLPPGYPHFAALNSRAWLMKPGGAPQWMDMRAPNDGADILMVDATLSENGDLNGALKGAYKGYNAVPERRHYHADPSGSHWKKRMEETFPDFKIESVSIGNLEKTDLAFCDTLQFSIPGAAQSNGDLMYLNPVLYTGFRENMFKQPERFYPVDIPHPFVEQHIIKLQIPATYAVEALPEKVIYKLPNNGGGFSFAAEQKEDGLISMTARLQISQTRYSPEDYLLVKELFERVAEKFGEQVVLRKTK